MSDFRPIRLAMVGLGEIARDQHLPAIASDTRFELVATVDPAGGLPDVPGLSSIERMLRAGASIDAVTIATPPQVRESVARCAVVAGLHVLLEKPPASTVLGAGGHRLVLDGVAMPAGIEAEYSRLYARFAGLIARGASDVDLTPLQLVADAFTVARISRCARYAP